MTGDKERKDLVKLLCMGSKWEFGGRREMEGSKGEIINQCSRRLQESDAQAVEMLRGF